MNKYSFYDKENGETYILLAEKRFGNIKSCVYGVYEKACPTWLEIRSAVVSVSIEDLEEINSTMHDEYLFRTGAHGLSMIKWVRDQMPSIIDWAESVGFWQVQIWLADEKMDRALLRLNIHGMELFDGFGMYGIDFYDETAMFADRDKCAFGKTDYTHWVIDV